MRYLILGAGPCGLTVANCLLDAGEDDFLVLERESEAGGLCRSVDVDGQPLDIGGGHFLDVRRPNVNEFLFRFMPKEEWRLFDRNSKIDFYGQYIDHPIEANIWQMKLDEQIAFLKSVAVAGCNIGKPMPEKFTEWILWKLGEKIADTYMLPYNRKVFGRDLDLLGTYWLEKLPNVSFEDTLLSCLKKKAYVEQPGHAQFYYPKEYGYGELWLRMGKRLGEKIQYESEVIGLDFDRHTVMLRSGKEYVAEKIITTIPWNGIQEFVGMPNEIRDTIRRLKHSSIEVEYHGMDMDTDAHWVYYPDENVSYHRILVRSNFVSGGRGYWTETNTERTENKEVRCIFRYINKYAYPKNTIDKPRIMSRLLTWCRQRAVFGLGRWGEHQHYNSDVTVEKAMEMVDCLK